ncbi:hypothetical protein [Janthinobacterium sp. PC23-8]|uniref:hypothetical protein n=1 Tax=Janthinobacterium sp. PC23-8 TaxID=2012679 RepID=UPI001140177A|nr:hypothetical protein [Janthinobacterium sp. PC23-8]
MKFASSSCFSQSQLCIKAFGAIFCLVASAAWAVKRIPTVPAMNLSSSEAHCLADNAELLLRDKGDPVLFYFDLCLPDDATTRSSANSLPVVPGPGGTAVNSNPPIKVSKALLRCIRRKSTQSPAFLDTNPVVLNTLVCKE